MKRKRMNQMAAKQAQAVSTAQPKDMGPPGMSFGISDCDLGASPVMNKTSFLPKTTTQQHQAKLVSPLQQARILSLTKGSGAQ